MFPGLPSPSKISSSWYLMERWKSAESEEGCTVTNPLTTNWWMSASLRSCGVWVCAWAGGGSAAVTAAAVAGARCLATRPSIAPR